MILVAFKAIDPVLSGQDGGFDSHTLPPYLFDGLGVAKKRGTKRQQEEIFGRVFAPIQTAARTVTRFLILNLSML